MPASNDPSLRYVLPAGSPLVANLAALWAADPKLASALESLEGQASNPVETTKAGVATVALMAAEGRKLYLHSRYQPIDEARRLVAAAGVEEKAILCVHGFGLGYHVEELAEAAGEESLIVVLEPDLLLLRTAFELRDFSYLIEKRRVVFLTALDKGDVYFRLQAHTALVSMGMGFVIHPPSVQLHGEFHRQIEQWLTEFAAYTRTNLNTLLMNGRRTCENIARNLGWYVATPSLARLRGRYEKRPAIIVSAGPSLRKNKHLLKEADGRAVIVAVQTTLQPLLEMGIEPHFVTSLDYHDICTRFFEKLPTTLRTELVAEPKATSAIFSLNPGPVSLCGSDLADKLVREMKLEKARLTSGATVAHLAYYLAEHLGCDPIIFIGQDLGFSDGLCYTPGTSYEDVWRPELGRFCTLEMKQWEQIVRERQILRKIPDQQGRPMYTEERLFTYLQQFERDFAATRTRIIDATEGGAMKRGATVMTLAEALEQFCTAPVGRVWGEHPGYRWELLGEARRCLEVRREEAGEVRRIAAETLPLLEEIGKHVGDHARVNRAIARVDSLRAKMNELHECYELIMQMTQLSELQRFQRDRQIASSKLDGVQRQRKQVERDIDNVRAIRDAAQEFEAMVEDVIGRIEAMQRKHAGARAA